MSIASVVPEKKLMLDKERTLKLPFGVLKRFKDESGSEFGRCVAAGFSIEETAVLLWCSFQLEDPDLTLEDVQNMIHSGNLFEIGSAITELIMPSFPEAEGDGGEPSRPTG